MKDIIITIVCLILFNVESESQRISLDQIEILIKNSNAINLVDKYKLDFLKSDTLMYEFLNNEVIESIFSPSYLEINDTCFVKLKCNYCNNSLGDCLEAKISPFKELFIKTKKKYYHVSFSGSAKKYIINEKTYLGLGSIFEIKEIFKLKTKYIVRVNYDLCYLDPEKGKWYFYLNGKLEEYKKIRKNSFPVHNSTKFLGGCKYN